MENQIAVKKPLFIQELQVVHSHYYTSHFFDASGGKQHSSFGYIVKGNVVLSSLSENISVPEGGLFYIPEGQRYHSVWTGSPDIEFYSIHIVWNQLNVESNDKLAMQQVTQPAETETAGIFSALFSLLGSDEYVERIRGISLFYQWYSSVFPLLRLQTNAAVSAALIKAIDYIQQNYTHDIDTAQLAAHCCVSESRLYHLFHKMLNITPVQYKNLYRVEKAAKLLSTTDLEIEQIATDVGYNSAIYFRETFKRITGSSPSAYRSIMRQNIDRERNGSDSAASFQ